MTPERLALLIHKYLGNTASPEEEVELTNWYNASNQQDIHWPVTSQQEAEAIKGKLLRKIQHSIHPAAKVIPFYKKTGWQAAAAILILLSAGAWFWFTSSVTPETPITRSPGKTNNSPIVPGGNKAILTLADGSNIILDSASNTTLATQGTTRVIKLNNGQLAYQDQTNKTTTEQTLLYNTIATPRGGQYGIILPDGSHVWLNAASKLRFPAAFASTERTVELEGEAYFEIAKDAAKPFRVHFTRYQQKSSPHFVEVLGTHFNVNAYDDETSIKTTLLEGKVKISAAGAAGQELQTAILNPGSQSSVVNNLPIRIKKVDTDEVVAWKNGLFNFNHADIKTVMRQIARWYDVEIVFEGSVSTETFEGEIPRNSTLSDVLKILELSAVHFKTEGRKVIVMP